MMTEEVAKKAKMWGLGALILALVTTLGAFAMRERAWSKSSQTSKDSITALETSLAESKTKESQSSKKASEYRARIALLDKQGKAQLDGNGNPIFNETSGSTLEEELNERWEQRLSVVQNELTEAHETIAELESKKSGPGFKAWNVASSYDFKLTEPGNQNLSKLFLGGGVNFLLGPFHNAASIMIGAPINEAPKLETTQGRVQITGSF